MSQTSAESDATRTTREVRLVPEFEVRRIPRPRRDRDERVAAIPDPALSIEGA
jgi:hypothetical protein